MSGIDRSSYLSKNSIGETVGAKSPSGFLAANSMLLVICLMGAVGGFVHSALTYTSDFVSPAFFEAADNEYVAIIRYIGLLAAAYLSRPLGGFLVSRYGDRHGRKLALQMLMVLLAGCSLLIAILPTYAHIGSIAPLLLMVVLFVQGGVFGGLLVLTWIYTVENRSSQRLALYLSAVIASSPFGAAICALAVVGLEQVLSPSLMISYGWRFVFLLGASLGLTAYYLGRHKLRETPIFTHYIAPKAYADNEQEAQTPFNRFNAVLVTALLSLVFTSLLAIVIMVIPKIIDLWFIIPPLRLMIANIMGIFALVCGMVFYSWLANKIGIGWALRLGTALLAFDALGFFYYLSNSGGEYIVPLYITLGFCSGITSLCILLIMPLFPVHRRLMSFAMIFNSIAVITGALLPFFLLYISQMIGFSPAPYIIFISIMTFIISLHACHPVNDMTLKSLDPDIA